MATLTGCSELSISSVTCDLFILLLSSIPSLPLSLALPLHCLAKRPRTQSTFAGFLKPFPWPFFLHPFMLFRNLRVIKEIDRSGYLTPCASLFFTHPAPALRSLHSQSAPSNFFSRSSSSHRYTKHENLAHVPQGKASKHGMYVYRLCPKSGQMVLLTLDDKYENPAFLRYHPEVS